MVKAGKLDIGKDKTLRKAEPPGRSSGPIAEASKGFGFVRPHGLHQKADQIFIPPMPARRLERRRGRGQDRQAGQGAGMNPEGRVVQVLARASGLFVGHYFEKDGNGYVKVDGTTFPDPIYVGDPGAKGARPGDKVAIEMARYPTPVREGEGVITEVLGPRGEPGVDTLAMIRALQHPRRLRRRRPSTRPASRPRPSTRRTSRVGSTSATS